MTVYLNMIVVSSIFFISYLIIDGLVRKVIDYKIERI